MAKNILQYSLLISCPGDVQDEVEIIQRVVNEFNNRYTNVLGIAIQTKHWKKNSYPQSGGKPQALLNEQFVEDCDLAIGILWTRFGTPTDMYGSGTEEEINIMLDANKQVFMYFSEKPIKPSNIDTFEYQRVQEFKRKYQNRGIYYTYTSNEEFEKKISAHLAQYFLSLSKVEEIKNNRGPKLVLKGISTEGQVIEGFHLDDFCARVYRIIAEYVDKIEKLIKQVKEIVLPKDQDDFMMARYLLQQAKISDGQKKDVEEFAKQLKVELPEDFFYLGNLQVENVIGERLEGTLEEKKKYRYLKLVCDYIKKVFLLSQIVESFKDYRYICLALENEGNDVDEDIELYLTFPLGGFFPLGDFPKLSYSAMKYLAIGDEVKKIFGIAGAKEFKEYGESRKRLFSYVDSSTFIRNPFGNIDYEQEYFNLLKSFFDYDIFKDANNITVRLKIDYLKHHTVIAFPSILFVKDDISSIEYVIKSKKIPDVQTGAIIKYEG